MNIFNTLSDFLFDKNYFIAFFEDNLYIYKYDDILDIKDNLIKVLLNEFVLLIKGDNLKIARLNKDEMVIKGNIKGVEKINE